MYWPMSYYHILVEYFLYWHIVLLIIYLSVFRNNYISVFYLSVFNYLYLLIYFMRPTLQISVRLCALLCLSSVILYI